MNKIKFFYYNEAIPLQTKTNFSYLEHLESRGKISINRIEGVIYLKDFGGYIDGTLHTDAINLNGTAITADGTELNYVDGVTSAIQTQMDTKTSTVKAIITAMVFG